MLSLNRYFTGMRGLSHVYWDPFALFFSLLFHRHSRSLIPCKSYRVETIQHNGHQKLSHTMPLRALKCYLAFWNVFVKDVEDNLMGIRLESVQKLPSRHASAGCLSCMWSKGPPLRANRSWNDLGQSRDNRMSRDAELCPRRRIRGNAQTCLCMFFLAISF